MAAWVSVLRVPKAGSSEDECEDAAAVLPTSGAADWVEWPVSVVVADGASESLLAKDWAQHLVHSLVDLGGQDARTVRDRVGFAEAIAQASRHWSDWIAEYPDRRLAAGRPVQWYEVPKLEKGAYATVLAARFEDGSVGQRSVWCAAALGDSCLFQVRGDELLLAFPIMSAADFDSTPALVNSRGHDQTILATRVDLADGDAKFGDQFFLCTDALSAWFLGEVERGGAPWEELYDFTRVSDTVGFAKWLAALRSAGRMRNDDVTVVHVDLG